MKKLYDFYCSVGETYQDSREFRPVMRLVDGKTYHECVETGQKLTSKWENLVLVAQAVDMTHVTINGVKQEGADDEDTPTISNLRIELESLKKDNENLRRDIGEIRKRHGDFLCRIKNMLEYHNWPDLPGDFLTAVGDLLEKKMKSVSGKLTDKGAGKL